jgi:hypothetical protein
MEEGQKCPPKHTIEWKVLLHNLDNNEQDATESWRRNNEIVPTGTKLLSEIGWYKEARELRKLSVDELAEFIVSHTKESFSQKKISNSYWMKEFGDLGRATQKINKVNLQVRKELFKLHPIPGKYHKKSGNQMRILKTTDGRSIFKQVDYTLKPVDILMSDRAVQMFSKAQKVGWTLDKTLNELGGFANYKQLFKQDQLNDKISDNTREQIITELASNYSYTVEVNTAKEKSKDYKMVDRGDGNFEPEPIEPEFDYEEVLDEDGNIIDMRPVLTEKSKKQIADMENTKPTQYYANLTVPGGTNYTEQEFSTPLITPSIKGHAQFATDKGIGWFRSDDKSLQNNIADVTKVEQIVENRFIFSEPDTMEQIVYEKRKDGKWYVVGGIAKDENGNQASLKDEWVIEAYNTVKNINKGVPTKTRRILEVQSDIFQKSRDIKSPDEIINELKKSGELQIKCD